MVFLGRVGMLHGDLQQIMAAALARSPCEELEVHHVVDDDRILPRAEIPRADGSGFLAEAPGQRARTGEQDVAPDGIPRQAQGLPVAAAEHESQVVRAAVGLDRFEARGVVDRGRLPLLLPGVLVDEPERTREETAGPVARSDGHDFALFVDRPRQSRIAPQRRHHLRVLRGGVCEVEVDKARSGLVRG
jgi:hypothetical protein